MIHVLVSHPVQDYAAWKPVFDSSLPMTKAAGINILNVFRGADNLNEVSVFCSAPSAEAFHQFFSNPQLGELMHQGGVLAPPVVQIFQAA